MDGFSCDGAIAHQARTCRALSIDSYSYLDQLERELGILNLKFDADHSDYSFVLTKNREIVRQGVDIGNRLILK